ncbi:hypothetical protein [Lichenibacterium ramalinae]|uniref:Uncharacterized protein n=1 Tax=Lichenibacterium ramalinae TaxID=2316527 RepID=A0A4Q2RFH5_9HYPH|nr:hypothetical protein [Lichenibacterium ramalinae]RYB06456.1 hypothetical protein D3272_06855 [Lichenibacterium ramalinae]
MKRDHVVLLRTAGADLWPLDRLCLDGDPPLTCEVEQVVEALGRVAAPVMFSAGSPCYVELHLALSRFSMSSACNIPTD